MLAQQREYFLVTVRLGIVAVRAGFLHAGAVRVARIRLHPHCVCKPEVRREPIKGRLLVDNLSFAIPLVTSHADVTRT